MTSSARERDGAIPHTASADAGPNCPRCRATNATTTEKTVSAQTYWRCLGCGHVWNPGRDRSDVPASRAPYWRL